MESCKFLSCRPLHAYPCTYSTTFDLEIPRYIIVPIQGLSCSDLAIQTPALDTSKLTA